MKAKRFSIKKLFQLNSWKRFFIAIICALGLIAGASVVATNYISPKINRSVSYSGGAEVLVAVKNNDGSLPSAQKVIAADKQILNRLTGGTSLDGTRVTIEGKDQISIVRKGVYSPTSLKQLTDEIINKPTITVTDSNNNPLFLDGKFNADQSLDFSQADPQDWALKLKPGSAVAIPNPSRPQLNQVRVKFLNNNAQLEWTKATEYISKKPYGQNKILIWANLKGLINLAKTKFPEEWKASGENIYKFVHVDQETNPKNLGNNKTLQPALKQFQFNAKKYLISEIPIFGSQNSEYLDISGQFSSQQATQLALNINYSNADFKLDLVSSSFINEKKSNLAYIIAWIAIAISLLGIATFFIIYYRLLGVVATFSMGLFVFVLQLFIVGVGAEFSPFAIVAMFVAVLLNVGATIVGLESFKSKMYLGQSVLKSNSHANKTSLSTIIDTHIVVFIFAVVSFFFGIKEIKEFSIILIFATLFTFVISTTLTRWVNLFLLKDNWLQHKPFLLGIHSKSSQKFSRGYQSIFHRLDVSKFLKYGKWSPIAILILAIIFYISFAGANHNFFGANFSIGYQSGTAFLIESKNSTFDLINSSKVDEILAFLNNNQGINQSNANILVMPTVADGNSFNIEVQSFKNLNTQASEIIKQIQSQFSNIKVSSFAITTVQANNIVQSVFASLALSLLLIGIFVFLRYNWSFALTLIITTAFNLLMIFAIAVIVRIQISTPFMIAFLALAAYSSYDLVTYFANIKQILSRIPKHQVYSKEDIKEHSQLAVRENAKKSLLIFGIAIAVFVISGIAYQAIYLSFSLAMIVGFIVILASSTFVAPWLIVKFEVIRNRHKQKRIDNKFWNVQKVYEQSFANINDFEK